MSDDGPLDDALDGVAHLQAAALELIAAARSFLDAAESAVADPDQARRAAATLAGVIAAFLDTRADDGRDGSRAGGGLHRVEVS